jgi:flagellin-like protein
MFENITDSEERGQVGIGTLIVFIALVLVAAIAAGVLINTAGFLQTQAEQTGEQSSDQVTDRLEPVETTGNVSNGSFVRSVDFVLQKAPGASDINVSKATLTFTGPDGTFRHEVSNSTNFNYSSFQDSDGSLAGTGSSEILNDESDRLVLTYILSINLTGNVQPDSYAPTHGNITSGQTAEVEITTQSGSSTIIQINAPQSLDGEESVTL